MALKVSVNGSGVRNLVQGLRARAAHIRSHPWRAELASESERWILENLKSEGSRIGASWPTLEQETVDERLRLGYSAGPRLRRTGDLHGSIEAGATNSGVRIEVDGKAAAVLNERFRFVAFPRRDRVEAARIIAKGLRQ